VWWFLLWVVLVVGAVAVLGYLGRRLFQQARALTREVATASDRLAALTAALESAQAEPRGHSPARR
jgi:hypothetical protein